MEDELKILHLSDLHFDKGSLRDQRILLTALFGDIRHSVTTCGAYDLVLFTGDLIAKGAYTDENLDSVVGEFLLPLIEAAAISPDRLFLVPGNHDVDLSAQSSIVKGARKGLTTEDEVGRYIQDVTKGNLETGLQGFNSVLDRIGSDSAASLVNNHYRAYTIDIRGIKVGIGALNSAWHANGAALDGDYGKLRIGRVQLDEVVHALGDATVKLALMHHPLSWLAPKDGQNTRRQLPIHFDALFHGHNHEPDAQVSIGPSNRYFVSNAGCLYQHREYFNGYCSLSYCPRLRQWSVRAREYFETRQTFDIAPRFAQGGEAKFALSIDEGAGTQVLVPSDEYVECVHAAFNARLLPTLVSDVAPKNLKSIFVEPLLSRASQRKIDGGGKNGSSGLFVPLKDIFQLKKSVVFLGNKDMGKTTLLHRIGQLSIEFAVADLAPFCAYVDCDVAGETRASLVDAIVTFTGGSYRKSEILELLNQGTMTVCFDNVKEHRKKQFSAVSDFCRTHDKCRYYVAMLENVEYSLSPDQVPRVVPESEIFYLHPFGRRETRILTQNWFGESAEECNQKVNDVLSLLGRLHVSRSPFLISALLWIREKGTQFSPVNQAEILDALIDGVMEKLSEVKDRSRIDSTIKRHYLASLSEHLHSTGKKSISMLDLERFTIDYFSSKGLPVAIGPFLVDLKAKGILLEVGDDVTFMFDAIRAFFLSTRLHENDELLEKALSREHFLEFGEELDYYTGRHRDQTEVLRKALALVKEFFESAEWAIDLGEFDKIDVTRSPINEAVHGKLLDATATRPDAELRQALLESVDDQTRGQDPLDPSRFLQSDRTGVHRYLESLRVASSILRNSELVGDVALKREAYAEFADGWCRVLIGTTLALDGMEELPGSSGNGKREDPVLGLLQGLLPVDNPGVAKYLLKLIVPNVIVSVALESIGTSKLQMIIEEHGKSATSTVQRVLDVFLLVDLRTPRWIHHLDTLFQQYHKNRFVCGLIFAKLFQVFMLGTLRPDEEHQVKGLLAEAITSMVSENRATYKNRIKARFLSDLEKKRLAKH